MNIRLYDNYEEDGQLSMFAEPETVEEPKKPEPESGSEIRIQRCSSCGKLLFVREEKEAFSSECNNCGIRYSQKNRLSSTSKA